MNKIDKNSKTPLYIQLMDILINKIENYMKENDQLDSEREICQKY
jgi:GntR family transcriptional regulator